MVEFETVKSEVRDFGGAGFVAVERKRVKDGEKEPTEFIIIARGFYLRDGTARRRNYVTIPDQKGVKDFVAKSLREV